ncbi:putative integral membrane protein [Rostrohypoxylon terebratum]|nr:putative integral membrane protein [Rostrohypoxylon terebratum]
MASLGLSAILPLVPVVSSTCSLWFAWDQYEFLTIFHKPGLRQSSSEILTPYFTIFFNRGAPRVLALISTTAFSCGAILRNSPGTALQDSGAYSWYLSGLLCAVGHMAWAPLILPYIRALQGNESAKEKKVAELETWLRIHTWRSLTVDLAAWVCCITATVKSLSLE